MSEVSGKVIIITGGGAGIGQALAVGLVAAGAKVHAISRSRAGLEQTRALAGGSGALSIEVADVADADRIEGLFTNIVEREGGVDLLVNNAAVYPKRPFQEFTPSDWRSGVATNLDGVAYCCRAAILAFPAYREAVVFNVGTHAYRGPDAGSTLYCATKAGVNALTRAIALDLSAAGSSLIVNEWIPGVFRTQMSGNTGEDPALACGRLVKAWRASLGGRGGRVFEGGRELLPPRSLRSRLLSKLLLRN